MSAEKTHARIAFDEPGPYPLDVKVYDGEGTLLRIIPGASLRERKLTLQRPPEVSRRTAKIPSVPMVKATTRAGRP